MNRAKSGMSGEKKPPFNCLLGIDPETVRKCKLSECPKCGWNKPVADLRRAYQREHGLRCGDGCSIEELEYGFDITDALCERLENGFGGTP